MLVVIPITNINLEELNWFARIIKLFKNEKNHKAITVSSRSDLHLANKIKTEIGECFSDFDCLTFDDDGPSGWPQGPNFYWGQTVGILKKRKNESPWFWMETDCFPFRDFWLDEIEKEYLSSGCSFLGCIEEQDVHYPSHLTGCAIYPSTVHEIIGGIWRWVHKSDIPFDVLISEKILSLTCQSRLMKNLYRTISYKIDNSILRFENLIHDHFSTQYLNFLLLGKKQRPTQVNVENVYIIHGCKDESLPKVIIKLNE